MEFFSFLCLFLYAFVLTGHLLVGVVGFTAVFEIVVVECLVSSASSSSSAAGGEVLGS